MTEKAGEVVRVVAEQDDSEGQVISRITCEWFGNSNEGANVMTMGVIEAIAGAAHGWRVAKAERGESQVKNPGAIR